MKKIQVCIVILVLFLSLVLTWSALAQEATQTPQPAGLVGNVEGESAVDLANPDVVAFRYGFSQSLSSYTPVAGGTIHGTASNDDQNFNAIEIGFPFTFNDLSYTQVSIQSNGFIAMGAAVVSSYVPLSTGSSNNVIAALGRDIQGNATTSELMSLLEGSAPDRVFTIQWTHYKRYGTGYVGDDMNFQIKLHETSNLVEVVYGPFTAVANAAPPTIQVGLRGASAADFNNRKTNTDWTATIAGTANTDYLVLTELIYPPSGLTFFWTPQDFIALYPDSSATACRGNTVDYALTATNGTTITDTITIAASGFTWPTTVDPTSLYLGANDLGAVNASVYIPWAAPENTTDIATLTATAQLGGLSGTATLETTSSPLEYTDFANVPLGREVRDASVVYSAGKLYKIGGYGYIGTTGAARAWVDIYDIATDTWTPGTDMPAARYWIDCEEIGGKIYCAGGYLSAGTNTLYIYDIASNTWSTSVATLPANRYNYDSVKLNGKYYVIGGYTTAVNNNILAYDPVADTWDTTLPNMTTARRYAQAGVIGGKIYVAGGYSTTYLDSVEVLDPSVPSWSAGPSMPMPWLNAADGVIADEYLVLTGGSWNSSSGASNGALVFDAALNEWSWLPLFNHIVYGAEGDGDGTQFWTVSGRMYENAVFSNSPYTTLADECPACVPVAGLDFTVDPVAPRPGIPATFSATITAGSPAVTYEWDFGDGTTGSGAIITHTYAIVGTYDVTVTTTNCDGASTSSVTKPILVEAGPLAVIEPLFLDATQCSDSQTTQTISICNDGNQPLTWSVSEEPGLSWLSEAPTSGVVASGDCADVTVTFDSTTLTPDVYLGTLLFETNDLMNLEVPVDISLEVAGAPTNAYFTFGPTAPIVGEQVSFNGYADALMPIDYSWDFGDGTTGMGQNTTHTFTNYGDFEVTMTASECGESLVVTDTVTVASCYSLVNEDFETPFPPVDWTVINNGGTCAWTRNDGYATLRPNYAGGEGFTADADSDRCGSGTTMDTELRTMTLDLTGVQTATLEYMTSYNDISTGGDFADTDVSIDGGTTWTTLLHWDEDHNANGPGELVSLDLTPYTGYPEVILRYHYYLATYDWWWEVDQVDVVGCYIPGAVPDIAVAPTSLTQTLYPGQTADQAFNIANSGLDWLDWTSDVGCGVPVTWLSTDPVAGSVHALADTDVTATFDSTGLPLGTYLTNLCIDSNDPDSPTVSIDATLIITGSPDITVSPLELNAEQYPDEVTTQNLEICNVGEGSLDWELSDVMAQLASIPGVTGVSLPADAVSIPQPSSAPALGETGLAEGNPVIGTPANFNRPEDIGDAWETMAPLPSGRVFNAVIASGNYVFVIGGTSDAGGLVPTNTNYRYDITNNTWATMAPMPAALDSIDGIAIAGLIYIPGSDPDNNTYVYDIAADSWSAIPANGGYTARAQYQVVAIGNNLYVLGGIIGGASTQNVWILNTTAGTWSAGVPMLKSRTSFSAAAIGSNIYVAGGVLYPGFTPDMTAEMFNGTSWSYIASVPNGGGAYTRWSYNADGMAPGALWLGAGRRDANWAVLNHAGFYDVATDTWTDSPTIPMLSQGRVYMEGDVASDGFFYVIGGRDSAGAIIYDTNERLMVYNATPDWLSEDPTSGSLPAGACVDVTVTFDSTGLAAATYTADILILSNDQDEPEVDIPVTLVVKNLADLSIVKTDAVDPVDAGVEIEYVVTVTNNGPTASTGATITDTLPAGVDFVSSPDCTADAGVVTCTLGALDAASSVEVNILAVAINPGTYTNEVEVLGFDNDPDLTNNTDSEDTTVVGYEVSLVYHDLEDVVHDGESIYATGDWNDWSLTADPLTPNADFSVFTVTLTLGMADYQYRYAVYTDTVPTGPAHEYWLQSYPPDGGSRMMSISSDATIDDYRDVTPSYYELWSPDAVTVIVGHTTPDIFGWLWVPGYTNEDLEPRSLIAELGYGTDLDPALWTTWEAMLYNGHGAEPNNAEHVGNITPTTVGVYSYAVRYNFNWGVGNPNNAYYYGDTLWDGEYVPADAGVLTVTNVEAYFTYLPLIFKPQQAK